MRPYFLIFLLAWWASTAHAQDDKIRIGEFTTTATVIELVGEEAAKPFSEKMAVDQPISWEIYVPPTYDAAKPAGVLVFVNSRNSGKIEAEWKAVMDATNLIYVGANDAGNEVDVPKRIACALLGLKLIGGEYTLDQERVYVSGFSGGSRVASMVATEYNRLFKGAVYNSGANFWGGSALPRYREMASNRYVFITGTKDFNLEDTKEVYNAYLQAGISQSKLVVIPDMEHKRPPASELEAALRYLDTR